MSDINSKMETWKPIPGYEGLYEVSDLGRVRSITKQVFNIFKKGLISKPGVVLKKESHYRGYDRVCLCKNRVCMHQYVHRLVALAFLANPENKAYVNHLDENKRNNAVINLEWATESENTRYYYEQRAKVEKSNAEF